MSAHVILKARTATAHAAIDADFSAFDLGCRNSYIAFLVAHARVLPALEAILVNEICLPPWRGRTDLLAEDLCALGHDFPDPANVRKPSDLPEMFGLLYVLEGSRLGGHLLSRRVGHGFAKQFLSAVHLPGEWRAFTKALEGRAEVEDQNWLESVIVGANKGYRFYADSVRQGSSR